MTRRLERRRRRYWRRSGLGLIVARGLEGRRRRIGVGRTLLLLLLCLYMLLMCV